MVVGSILIGVVLLLLKAAVCNTDLNDTYVITIKHTAVSSLRLGL